MSAQLLSGAPVAEAVGADQALVITLPVRDGASFLGNAPAAASVAADGVDYEIGGSNDLLTFDQNVSEVVPALTGTPDMPLLNTGWTYRTFRLDGAVGADRRRRSGAFAGGRQGRLHRADPASLG